MSSFKSDQFDLPAEPPIVHAFVVALLQSVRVDLMRSLKFGSSDPADPVTELTVRVDCQHFNPGIYKIGFSDFC